MKQSLEELCVFTQTLENAYQELKKCQSLAQIVWTAWYMGMEIAKKIVEQELSIRAESLTQWSSCPKCGSTLLSKGMRPRQIKTLVGIVGFSRRVGRCRNGCRGVQQAPLDQELGLLAYQQTSLELMQMGCLLTVFVPFETACTLLEKLTGVKLSTATLWNWVQSAGKKACGYLEQELVLMNSGVEPIREVLPSDTESMPLIIGADGVMVPFRQQALTPKGKTVWREIKVAILARLGYRHSRTGKQYSQLHHRRLVAVLGDINAFKPRLWLEALRCGSRVSQVVWISDGGRGFWRLFQECFFGKSVAILDFYHAAQHLWQAAAALLDGRTTKARGWFEQLRHQLRHGEQEKVLADLAAATQYRSKPTKVMKTLRNVYAYFQAHEQHINYGLFKSMNLPLGSGMVESACKWLIQQRFKSVGMRWSEDGFNHLLHLRLAWVNGRFDHLFPNSTFSSPNR
ncbi:ISKra4 family transposase [Nostoc sp.]|uniref:ISKra4 family transposase n=1 Tax=Nostoc sp. TaxID=1180 RepID=UPI003FA562F9